MVVGEPDAPDALARTYNGAGNVGISTPVLVTTFIETEIEIYRYTYTFFLLSSIQLYKEKNGKRSYKSNNNNDGNENVQKFF